MDKLLRKLVSLLKSVLYFFRTLQKIPKAVAAADMPSYYPDRMRKSRGQRVLDNLKWLLKYQEVNDFYTLYGLDLVDSRDPGEYKDHWNFMHERNAKNQYRQVGSQIVLLRDKYLFYKYMKALGMSVAEVFAVIRNGRVCDRDLRYVGEEFLEGEKDYFIKSANGECASFVKHVDSFADYQSLKDSLQDGDYIVQRRVVQSPAMDKLNGKAINTMRIVTIYNEGEPYVFTALLRVGTAATGNVDNWAAGGIAVNIEADGHLGEVGYYKPQFGQTTQYHPDTNIRLSDFQVPLYAEAKALVCEAHRAFYGIESIGWDVAVSDQGLVFIEGNDNWEISLHQAADRPLRKEWEHR